MKSKKNISILCIITVVLLTGINTYAVGINTCTHTALGWGIKPTITALDRMECEWLRDEIRWSDVEKSKNVYKSPDYVDWVEETVKNNKNPLCILGFGNSVYVNTTTTSMPTKDNDEYWNAWLNYVRFVVNEYKGKIPAYEVWNEPNITGFNPNGTYEDYAKLYIETRNVIKSIDPNAIVLCGSITGINNEWTEGILTYIKNNGGLSQIDAFSIHMYNTSPEGGYMTGLNSDNSIFKSIGYTGPIWMTENGVAVGQVTETEQAALLIRTAAMWEYFLKEKAGTSGYNFWYDLRNDGLDTNNNEHNFGLVDFDYNPKPAYYAAKIYNKLAGDMKFESLTTSLINRYTAKYSNSNGDAVYILWTTSSSSKTLSVNLSGSVSYIYDYLGNLKNTYNTTGAQSFTVTSQPTLVYCTQERLMLKNVDYDTDKNVVTVSGKINNESLFGNKEITIELLDSNNAVVQSSKTSVDLEGKFNKWFSVDYDGVYTVKAYYDSVTDLKTNVEMIKNNADTNKPNIGALVKYDKSARTINVTGMVADYASDEIAILVLPKNIDINNYIFDNVVYIGQVNVLDGLFAKNIVLPNGASGDYSIYLNVPNTENKNIQNFNASEQSGYVYVASFSASKTSEMITASAVMQNFNDNKKEATIIIAQYDKNNTLLGVKTGNFQLDNNIQFKRSYTFTADVDASAVKTVAYIWDQTSIYPLAKKIDVID